MPDISTNNPDGSPAQNALLFYGRQAVIASTWKAYASLANNQTLIVAENSSGTPVMVTFEIEKSASGWTPAGGAVVVIDCTAAATLVALLAVVRDFLNARPNAAYTWSINGTNDGLDGTAKYAGSPWNIYPTGTTLTAGSVTTIGLDAIASNALSISELGDAYASGARMWEKIEVYAPTGDATSKDFTIAPADWSRLRFEVDDVGIASGATTAAEIQPDGSTGGSLFGTNDQGGVSTTNSLFANAHGVTQLAADAHSFDVIELRKRADGKWAYIGDFLTFSVSNNTITGRGSWRSLGTVNAFTSFLRITYGASAIRANKTKITLWGMRT